MCLSCPSLLCTHLSPEHQVIEVVEGPSGVLSQRNHNCNAFMSAINQHLRQLPADCVFSTADLEAEHEERPHVANCLLYMRSLLQQPAVRQLNLGAADGPTLSDSSIYHHQQQQQHGLHSSSGSGRGEQFMVTPPSQRSSSRLQQVPQYGLVTPASVTPPYGHTTPSSFRPPYGCTPGTAGSLGALVRGGGCGNSTSPLSLPGPSPLTDGYGGLSHASGCGSSSSAGHHHSAIVRSSSALGHAGLHGGHIAATSSKGAQAAAGVTRLMQQCTSMLKERMFPAEQVGAQRCSPMASGPDSAMKALGPVLEGVLGQLTEEYERRLLTKDHELGRAVDARNKAEREMQRMQVWREGSEGGMRLACVCCTGKMMERDQGACNRRGVLGCF